MVIDPGVPQERMSIVLQHIRSLLYFQGPGSWARELGEAFDFGHSQRAIDYTRLHRLSGMQVIVVFIDNDQVETHIFPIQPPPPMPVVATAAGSARRVEDRSTYRQDVLGCEL